MSYLTYTETMNSYFNQCQKPPAYEINTVLARQKYKCANNPNSVVGEKLKGYRCLLWRIPEQDGVFDETGYHIVHIQRIADGGSNDSSNLQALCHACHARKTSIETSDAETEELPEEIDSSSE